MAFHLRSILLILNLINLVHTTQRPVKSTNMTTNSTKARSNSDGDDDGDDSKVTIAVVLGVGLTVVIFSCVGYFLCRGHCEQKKFKNHRQLLKMERLNKNGTASESKPENEQSKEFAEEVL